MLQKSVDEAEAALKATSEAAESRKEVAALRKQQREMEEKREKLRQSEKEQRLRRVKEAAERDHVKEMIKKFAEEKGRVVALRDGFKRTLEEDPATGTVIQETFQTDVESLVETVTLSKGETEQRLHTAEKRLEKTRKERMMIEETMNACLGRVDKRILTQLQSCREEKTELSRVMEIIARDIEESEVREDEQVQQ